MQTTENKKDEMISILLAEPVSERPVVKREPDDSDADVRRRQRLVDLASGWNIED